MQMQRSNSVQNHHQNSFFQPCLSTDSISSTQTAAGGTEAMQEPRHSICGTTSLYMPLPIPPCLRQPHLELLHGPRSSAPSRSFITESFPESIPRKHKVQGLSAAGRGFTERRMLQCEVVSKGCRQFNPKAWISLPCCARACVQKGARD